MHGRSMDLALSRLTGKIEDKCIRCKADIMHALNRNRSLNKSFAIKRLADNIDKDCQHEANERKELSFLTMVVEKEFISGETVNYYAKQLANYGGFIIFVNEDGEVATAMLVYAGTGNMGKITDVTEKITEYPLQLAEVQALMDAQLPSQYSYGASMNSDVEIKYDGTMYMYQFNDPVREKLQYGEA